MLLFSLRHGTKNCLGTAPKGELSSWILHLTNAKVPFIACHSSLASGRLCYPYEENWRLSWNLSSNPPLSVFHPGRSNGCCLNHNTEGSQWCWGYLIVSTTGTRERRKGFMVILVRPTPAFSRSRDGTTHPCVLYGAFGYYFWWDARVRASCSCG